MAGIQGILHTKLQVLHAGLPYIVWWRCLDVQSTRFPEADFTNLVLIDCSHFILKWFHLNSFGAMCFLEESNKKMQKIHILKILRVPSIRNLGVYEELISKTSYIHSYMLHVLICRSGHSKEANFQQKNLLQMENVDTNWNSEQKISKNSNSTILRAAFWPCHKIWTYIKKNKGIKSCLVSKPLLFTPVCHSFPLLITL